jgi:hypothetical protein
MSRSLGPQVKCTGWSTLVSLVLGLAVLAIHARAAEWPVTDAGQTIGVIRYDPATIGPVPECWGGSGEPRDRLEHFLKAVSDCLRRSRVALKGLGWPLSAQAVGFVVEIGDLGPERLGLATSPERMKLTIPDRIDDDEDHLIRLYSIVAHEYFHLCQFRMQGDPGHAHERHYLWWMEATALYFEYCIAPRVPGTVRKMLTYEDALDGARGRHATAGLESGDGGSSLGYNYAPLAFLLTKAYGNSIIYSTWSEIARSVRAAIETAVRRRVARPDRVTFASIYREYALHLLAPGSEWIRTRLGLDMVRLSPVMVAQGAPQVSTALNLPGHSFQVFAPDSAGTDFPALRASLSGDAQLEGFLVVDGERRHRVIRWKGQQLLDLTKGRRFRLLVLNAGAEAAEGAISIAGSFGAENDRGQAE